MEMESKRLVLRPWQDSDAEVLYQYAQDPRVGPRAGWPVHTSVENSLQIIHDILSAEGNYAVVLKKSGELVGCVGIKKPDQHVLPHKPDEVEVGYWLGVPFWGQSIIPEAVERLLQYCFEEMGCSAVWCGYYDGNNQSRRVQEKCGFIFHHTEPNITSPMGDIRTEHFTYQSKTDWQNRQNTLKQTG